jgi:chromosome segregation ATPase
MTEVQLSQAGRDPHAPCRAAVAVAEGRATEMQRQRDTAVANERDALARLAEMERAHAQCRPHIDRLADLLNQEGERADQAEQERQEIAQASADATRRCLQAEREREDLRTKLVSLTYIHEENIALRERVAWLETMLRRALAAPGPGADP